jgi:photosystem II stability/assembly factor-like uncharacterized protein
MLRSSFLQHLVFVFAAIFLFSSKTYAQNLNIHELMQRKDLTLNQMDAIAKKHFEKVGKGQGSGYKQYERWRFEQKFHLRSDGSFIPREEEAKSYEFALRSLKKDQSNERAAISPWTELGPKSWTYSSGWNPGVGRLTSVAIHPSNESIIYVSSPGGGIWKSTDAAMTWTPLIDFVNSSWMNVYNLSIDPSNQNTIYAGLSSGGVLKSTDAGATWATTGSGPSTIRKVLVHPTNSSIVFAAANNGVYRSTNGGASWTSVQSGSFQDIEFKADDPSIMFASTSSSSFYRSADTGATWTLKTLEGSGRTLIGVSPNNADVIYIAQANGNVFGRFYKSTDAGLNFTVTIVGSDATNTNFFGYSPTGNDTKGQATYDMAICVSATNINEVHIAGIICWKSSNGGTSFTAETVWSYPNSTGYNHADVHGLEWVNNNIYSVSDGGIYKSTDNGDNWTDLSSGLGIRQLYRIACAKSDPEKICGGAQDNGTVMRQTNGTWKDWLGADGMDCIFSPTNANIAIGTSQYGSIYKTTNGGSSYSGLSKPADGNWVTPILMHPTSHDTVYGGWDGIYRSVNGGTNWTKLTTSVNTGNMDCLTISPTDTRYIYGSSGSTIYRTSDAGATWTSVSAGATVSSICVSPLNPQKIWITTTATSNNVRVSTDRGTTFTNINSGLPAVAARSIVVDNEVTEGLYVGMNVGVYYKDNVNTAWIIHSSDLPLVAINEIELQQSSRKVRVGTYGRGIWESSMQNIPVVANAGADVTVSCASPSATLTASGGSTYLWSTGQTTASINVSPMTTTTYTVTVTSSMGETASDAVIVSTNKTAPSPNAGADVTVTCSNPSVTLTATGGVSYTWNNGTTQGAVVSPMTTTTYTVTVTGSNGCTASDDVIVTTNRTAPTANAGADITLTNLSPSATLTASGGVNYLWSTNANTASISVNNTMKTTYFVTVTAVNGCTAVDDITVFYDSGIVDNIAPVFTSVPTNITINCEEASAVPNQNASINLATATDEWSLTMSCVQTSTKGTSAENCNYYNYAITNVWTATDGSGNTATASQIITVIDVTNPILSPVSNVTISQNSLTAAIPTATDNCMSVVPVTIVSDITVASPSKPACFSVFYTRTRTYRATDACGNTATASHVITVSDQVLLTCPSDKTLNTNSDGINNYNCTNVVLASNQLYPTFSDACDLSVLRYMLSGVTSGNGSGSIAGVTLNSGVTNVTYTAVFTNPVSCSFNVTVTDKEAPKISLTPTVVIDNTCNFPTTLPNTPTLTDNCSGTAPTLQSVIDVTADFTASCATKVAAAKYTKQLKRTWRATDISGNSSTAIQTFYLRDNVAPTASCRQDVTVAIGTANVIRAASTFNNASTDNCASTLTFKGCIGTTCTNYGANLTFTKAMLGAGTSAPITVRLQVLDACGNAAVCNANMVLKKIGTLSNANTGSTETAVLADVETESTPAILSTVVTEHGVMKCFPNPFSEDLNLQYNLTHDVTSVVLKVYDNQGRVVAKNEQGESLAGYYSMRWNLSNLEAGMYHVCLEIDGKCTKTERIILMK